MKKRNQIDQRRAVQQFRLFAIEQNAGNACSVTATQTMYMYCTGYTGAGQYYTSGSTIGDIIAATATAASLTTTRSSVTNVRNYP